MQNAKNMIAGKPLLRSILALLVAFCVAPPSAHAQQAAPSSRDEPKAQAGQPSLANDSLVQIEKSRPSTTILTKVNQAQVRSMLIARLQSVVDHQQRIEGQAKILTVDGVTFEDRPIDGLIAIVDLSRGYIPRNSDHLGSDLEDQLSELTTEALELLKNITNIKGVDFLFDGKSIYFYYPNDWRPSPRPLAKRAAQKPLIVIDPGHGIYHNFRFNDWRAQRDPSNGITEDFITPEYASDLEEAFKSHAPDTTIALSRSTSSELHARSGEPWWKLGARYYLKELYPKNPEIWHSLPQRTGSLRQRDEDIDSRPLYANHIGASAIIHLHTNASSNASATGTRGFYQTGRAEDKKLANSVLCYTKEQIHSLEGFENFAIADNAAPTNKGENRLAVMPSVIVEVAFHTNATDAAALRNPAFRHATMTGVEKGYRMYAKGLTACEPFKINDIIATDGAQNTPISIRINYGGHPQFPVIAKLKWLTCPSGWSCPDDSRMFADGAGSELGYSHTCHAPPHYPSATFQVQATLVDAEGVKSNLAKYSYTCTTPG